MTKITVFREVASTTNNGRNVNPGKCQLIEFLIELNGQPDRFFPVFFTPSLTTIG